MQIVVNYRRWNVKMKLTLLIAVIIWTVDTFGHKRLRLLLRGRDVTD